MHVVSFHILAFTACHIWRPDTASVAIHSWLESVGQNLNVVFEACFSVCIVKTCTPPLQNTFQLSLTYMCVIRQGKWTNYIYCAIVCTYTHMHANTRGRWCIVNGHGRPSWLVVLPANYVVHISFHLHSWDFYHRRCVNVSTTNTPWEDKARTALNTTRPKQSLFQRKLGYLRWNSNPQHLYSRWRSCQLSYRGNSAGWAESLIQIKAGQPKHLNQWLTTWQTGKLKVNEGINNLTAAFWTLFMG